MIKDKKKKKHLYNYHNVVIDYAWYTVHLQVMKGLQENLQKV